MITECFFLNKIFSSRITILHPIPTYTEEQLIALLKEQNKKAFDYLYANYSPVLFGVVKRIVIDNETAQDVLQDVFVKIWNNIKQYDSKKGRIYTWMINVARNSAIDKLRSKGEIMKSKIQSGEDVVNNMYPKNKTEISTDTIGLKNLVAQLKPDYKVIVDLAYFKGYTLEEISKNLDTPLGTVKTRMRHAIKLLRNKFGTY